MNDIIMNIGVLEDNASLRESISTYLALRGEYKIVFSTGRSEQVFRARIKDKPDFILLDEHLEDALGTSAIKTLRIKFPQAHIILMTGDEDPQLIVRALEEGASGFLYKPFSLSQIEVVLNEIIENGSFLQPKAATNLIKTLNSRKSINIDKLNKLTKKEKDVVDLITHGKSYKEASELLKISVHTINHHMKNVYLKFDINTKGQLFNLIMRD